MYSSINNYEAVSITTFHYEQKSAEMLLLTQHPHAIVIELHKKSAGDVAYYFESGHLEIPIK